jgi:hypothetical protein
MHPSHHEGCPEHEGYRCTTYHTIQNLSVVCCPARGRPPKSKSEVTNRWENSENRDRRTFLQQTTATQTASLQIDLAIREVLDEEAAK